jgi:hypothetical protein
MLWISAGGHGCVWVNNGANVPIISLIAVQMIAFSLMGVVGGYSRVGVLYADREPGLQLHGLRLGK